MIFILERKLISSLKKLKQFLDHILLLFPFEKKYFEKENINCTFVGHPLLEDDEKLLLTEPGEFKVASISNDTSLVVTRKHWGGTDVVPFWKQTTETEVTAVVSYL